MDWTLGLSRWLAFVLGLGIIARAFYLKLLDHHTLHLDVVTISHIIEQCT